MRGDADKTGNESGSLQDWLRADRVSGEEGWLKAKRRWEHSGQALSLGLTPLRVRTHMRDVQMSRCDRWGG